MRITIPERIKSRKFLLAMIYGILVGLNKGFEMGLSDDELNKILGVVVTYIVAEGAADTVSRLK